MHRLESEPALRKAWRKSSRTNLIQCKLLRNCKSFRHISGSLPYCSLFCTSTFYCGLSDCLDFSRRKCHRCAPNSGLHAIRSSAMYVGKLIKTDFTTVLIFPASQQAYFSCIVIFPHCYVACRNYLH